MAIVIKNTFLDVTEPCDEPCGSSRRSQSVPREWKPTAKRNMSVSNAMSIDTCASPRSNVSFYSAVDSSEALFSSGSAVSALELYVSSASDGQEVDADVAGVPPMQFGCVTPTSSLNSPREDIGYLLEPGCGVHMTLGICSETDTVMPSCYLCQEAALSEELEPETEPETYLEAEHIANSSGARTKLKVEAPVFKPAPNVAGLDAVISCLHLALTSCGQIRDIKTERGPMATRYGTSPILISGELQSGPCASSRSYDVVHLTKQALEAITARLPTITLLSARVQKDECGYSLRSSIACIPDHAQDCMCWDMFRKGYCPRRSLCRWYHPQDSDLARIRVSIRYGEDGSDGDEQFRTSTSMARHQISLGALVQ